MNTSKKEALFACIHVAELPTYEVRTARMSVTFPFPLAVPEKMTFRFDYERLPTSA